MRAAYKGPAGASHDLFFALFSGGSAESDVSPDFGQFVHIFDWSGRFVGYIRLEVEAVAITVDPEASVLYALEHDPVPTVSAYDLVGLDAAREQ